MKILTALVASLLVLSSTSVSAYAGGRHHHRGTPHCRGNDVLGSDGKCHPRVDKAFEAFKAACEEQAAKRRALGLHNAKAVIKGGPGQVCHCHVEGGFVESGKL
ncbi:hypothetical protein A3A38_04755 [Candidatus Kaiserbacteria bacterium RIFCSPLOWO2_01_FULL_53_17]|uniref:Uncharacterized protein n=1 Tax=Candidatus Kaiserbacteria bacterium RIFCSPLOWO2_01_FULL_53_17 TaxID=1798511 RepID=A0A1F6EHQ1_9BACT|nr:MAG: hypothetical protein A3A38_04755 [Candidatus Kaiserbacteria bacterium RIFCSPLOWO2_01_FULL_53_17]